MQNPVINDESFNVKEILQKKKYKVGSQKSYNNSILQHQDYMELVHKR